MTFPEAITDRMPPDDELVAGVVTGIGPLQVSVRGATIEPGTLGSYIPVVGDPVQLIRQDATWLVLGSSASGVDATNSVVSFADNTIATSTASGTYVNVTGAVVTFLKRSTGSRVRVDGDISAFISVAANTKPRYGLDFISLDGLPSVRVDLMEMLINPLATHTMVSGSALFSGIAAGNWTVQLLWLRAAGAGTLNINADDWVSFIVAEVA